MIMEKLKELEELIALAQKADVNLRRTAKNDIDALDKSRKAVMSKMSHLKDISLKCDDKKRKLAVRESGINAYKLERDNLKVFERARKKELDRKIRDEEVLVSDLKGDIALWESELEGGNAMKRLENELLQIEGKIALKQNEMQNIKKDIEARLGLLYDGDIMNAILQNKAYVEILARCKITSVALKESPLFDRERLKEFKLDFLVKAALGINIVGETIEFGEYMSVPIEWIVLAQTDYKILVLSKYGLFKSQYNDKLKSIDWKSCDIRRWLNEVFINDAFMNKEKLCIETTDVVAKPNPNYDTASGENVKDKIFLLSIDAAIKYFSSSEKRRCTPFDKDMDGKENCRWWLRTPGFSPAGAACVNEDGELNYYGYGVDHIYNFVRPAMWLR